MKTFICEGFTLLPCQCGSTGARFYDKEAEDKKAGLRYIGLAIGRSTFGLKCVSCGQGTLAQSDTPENRCGMVDGWNTSYMMGRDPVDGDVLPSADGSRTAEFVRLDMLDDHTTNGFGAFMMFGRKKEQAEAVLRYFRKKAELEDACGCARTGVPITSHSIAQRTAMIEGLAEYIRTGDFEAAFPKDKMMALMKGQL